MSCVRVAVALLLAVCAYPAEKKPLTHEVMWAMKRVGAPVPSPDGKWVIVSVAEPDYDLDKTVSDLWIVPTDGSAAPRRLTFSKSAENGVDWSPDSRKIAFSAKREGDEQSQIYVLDLGGGEAIRVTELTMGASSPEWSPDAKRILFHSKVYPGADSEDAVKKAHEKREKQEYKAYTYDGFPIRYWNHWLDDTEVHLFVQDAKPGAEARDLLAGTQLAAQPGFGASSGGSFGPVWAPDGKFILFTAKVNKNQAAYATVITHLYELPLASGEPKDLTPGPDSYGSARFRPDGKALYALFEPTNRFVYNASRLVKFDWPGGGNRKLLTADWDRSVAAYALAPASDAVFLQANDDGSTKIFRMAGEGGAVTPVVRVKEGTYAGLAVPSKAPATVVLAGWQSHRSPNELVRIDPEAKSHRALTAFNKEAAAAIDAQPARHFWFRSKRGRRIHNILVLPPGFDESKKYPLVLFIHGGPHGMSADDFHIRWNLTLMASPGYVVMVTNYTGSVGFGEKFSQAIQGDPLKTPGEEINQAVDEAIRRFPFIDETRLAAGGASYGGHLSNWLQATTTRFRCLYSHAGEISLTGQWATSDVIYHREKNSGGPPWEGAKVWKEQSPFTYAAKFKTPVLLTIGVNDFRVPLNQTLWYWSTLKRLQVPSRLVVFPRAYHWIMNGEDGRFFYKELLDWLAKYLGKE